MKTHFRRSRASAATIAHHAKLVPLPPLDIGALSAVPPARLAPQNRHVRRRLPNQNCRDLAPVKLTTARAASFGKAARHVSEGSSASQPGCQTSRGAAEREIGEILRDIEYYNEGTTTRRKRRSVVVRFPSCQTSRNYKPDFWELDTIIRSGSTERERERQRRQRTPEQAFEEGWHSKVDGVQPSNWEQQKMQVLRPHAREVTISQIKPGILSKGWVIR